MSQFFGLLYLVFFIGCVTAALFILFHLLRYALDKKMALFMSLVFTVVTLVLLTTNTILFLSLPLDTLVPAVPTPPRSFAL